MTPYRLLTGCLPDGAAGRRDSTATAVRRYDQQMSRSVPPLPAPLQSLAWERDDAPSTATVGQRLRDAGVDPYAWSNGPGDRYAAHRHPYTKLLMCAEGSITFLVGRQGVPVELRPGDGFVLPPDTEHAAIVGPEGCTCLEGHR